MRSFKNLFNAAPKPAAPARHRGAPVAFAKARQSIAQEAMNPVANLSISQAQAIFDQARRGCYARLHHIFAEIERADPTLFVCVERRASALAELPWKIERGDARRHRAADEGLAAEQIAFLETAFADCGNLPEAVEHLALSFFRGFAAVQPWLGADSATVKRLELLDSWNLCLDRERRAWQWNASATIVEPGEKSGLVDIPPEEIVLVSRRQFIDYPALAVYIRSALGEADWGRFLERYGVPPCTIIMPEFADKAEESKFLQAAQDMADAGNGALPYGSVVQYATEARGTNPFTEFLKHQQQLVVLMATGGLATSLETAQGLGSGTSDAHTDTWRTIVRRDSRVIANALNRQLAERLLAAAFPGLPMLAEFAFDTEPPQTSAAVFADATSARAAGYTISKADLEQLTGYTLIPYEAAAPAFPPPQTQWKSPDGAAAASPDIEVQSAALNGAQISSIVSIISDAAAGKIPLDSVLPMLKMSFPTIPESQLLDLVASLSGFRPAQEPEAQTPSNLVASRLQNARKPDAGKTSVQNAPPPQNANAGLLDEIAKTLAFDLRPAAARVAELLDLPEAERAKAAAALAKELPSLLPGDPEMAAVMEGALAEAFAAQAMEGPKS